MNAGTNRSNNYGKELRQVQFMLSTSAFHDNWMNHVTASIISPHITFITASLLNLGLEIKIDKLIATQVVWSLVNHS
jgi:hypothetical protein